VLIEIRELVLLASIQIGYLGGFDSFWPASDPWGSQFYDGRCTIRKDLEFC
jgi:hypothetical protein